MAKVLGVTRAGYDAWKSRAGQRAQRAVARRRLDEAVAWEYEVSGGTYGAPRISHALTRAGVDVGVRAVAASMRRLGPTGLHARPRPAKRGRRGPVAHEDHCARQWDQVRPTACGSRTLPTPAVRARLGLPVRRARCALAPSARIRHGRAAQHALWSSPRSTWPRPPVVVSPAGSCSTLIGEHSSPPRSWPPTCAP